MMRFNENEIKLLLYVIGLDKSPRRMDLSKALNLNPRTISRLVSGLENKGLLARENDEVVLSIVPPAEAFKRLYFFRRASPYNQLIADRRVDLLAALDRKPKSVVALVDPTIMS